MITPNEKSILSTVKTWLFPSIMSFLAIILYDDIKEIKSDVKSLLAQTAADHVEIINLKSQVENLNNKVFAYNKSNNDRPYVPDTFNKVYAALIQDNKNEKREYE
jgi:hypothetical protein